MSYPKIAAICLAIVLCCAAAPAEAFFEGCFCRKADPSKKVCGELLKFDADEVIRMKTELGTIDVRPIEFAACRDKEKEKDKDKYKDKERDKPGVISVPIGEGERFGIFGSNTIGERLMPALIKAYGQREGLVAYGETCDDTFRLRSGKWVLSIECRSDGTQTGIPALAEGRADIAMLSRPITTKEKEQMARAGYSKMDTAKHEAVIARRQRPWRSDRATARGRGSAARRGPASRRARSPIGRNWVARRAGSPFTRATRSPAPATRSRRWS